MSSMKGLGRRVLTVMGETLRGGGRDKQKLPKDKFRKPNKGFERFPFQETKKPAEYVMVHPDPDGELIMKNKDKTKNKDKPTKQNENTTGISSIMIDGMLVLVDQKKFKSGKVCVHPDADMAFVASIIQKEAVEGGNSIYWFTPESGDAFKENHSNASTNLAAALSAGQGRFQYFFDKDPTKMAEDPVLSAQKYARMYMAFPESPDDDASVEDDQKFVRKLFTNAMLMLTENGIIKVLHLDSSWDIKELAGKCGLRCLSDIKFNTERYPGFFPRRGRNDEKIDPKKSRVYTFYYQKPKPQESNEVLPNEGAKTSKVVNSTKKAKGSAKPHNLCTTSTNAKTGVIHGGLIRASSMKKLTGDKTHLSRYAGIQASAGLKMLTNTCTQSASIVPRAYYANMAGFPARSYVEGDLSDSDSRGLRAKGTGLVK